MGAAFSNPMDEANRERLSEIITSFVQVFATSFPKAYKDALIESIKENSAPEEGDENQLPEIPTPSHILKKGTITKKCAFLGNWKPNHFVALNKADNYRIDYYDKEGGALKGSINGCGYHVSVSDMGIDLEPGNDSRRTYCHKFETAQEKEEWEEIFRTACRRADRPKNDDAILAKAFERTYRVLRWNYGYYGGYSIDYSEAEQLADLCQKVVYSELIDGVIAGIPDGPLRNMIVKTVRKTVDQQIDTMCSAAWNSAVSAAKGAKERIEACATELLTPLFEEENKIKEQIITKTNEKTTPYVETLSTKTCQPVIDAISGPIVEAFVASIQGLHSCITANIKAGNYDTVEKLDLYSEVMLSTLDCAFMDGRDENPLSGAWKVMKPFQSEVLKKIDSIISSATGSISADDIYSMVTDSMTDVVKRAVYAFQVAMKGEGDYTYSENAATNHLSKDILARYVHDVKLSFKALLVGILSGIVSPAYESIIITPSMTLVTPIQEAVDTIPVPGVSDLIDLEGLSTEVLETVLDDALNTCVDSVFEKNSTKLDETLASL